MYIFYIDICISIKIHSPKHNDICFHYFLFLVLLEAFLFQIKVIWTQKKRLDEELTYPGYQILKSSSTQNIYQVFERNINLSTTWLPPTNFTSLTINLNSYHSQCQVSPFFHLYRFFCIGKMHKHKHYWARNSSRPHICTRLGHMIRVKLGTNPSQPVHKKFLPHQLYLFNWISHFTPLYQSFLISTQTTVHLVSSYHWPRLE